MKKALFLLCLVPQALFAQKLERYCEMVATARLFSTKVTIQVDYGDQAGFFDRRIRDDEGKVVKFNTLVDAMNYMGTQNWKLVNAFPVTTGGSSGSVYHFYFKKDYDASELVPQNNNNGGEEKK